MAFFVSFADFEQFLGNLAKQKPVYVPRYVQNNLQFQRLTPEAHDGIVYDGVRVVEPLKSFFFKIKQRVAEYPEGSSSRGAETVADFMIVGGKACDLKSVEISDDTFMAGEIKDPFYVESRNKVTIISCDCSSPKESCFCTMLGLKPYPEAGFDLNLSRIFDGLVVEIGSEEGQKLISSSRDLFLPASAEQVRERDTIRAAVLSQVKRQNEKFSLSKSYQDIVKEKLDSPVWKRYSGRCVSCAACLSVCPTCHCFLLYDEKVNESFERVRVWDFCYHYAYARVAGGANPRPTAADRFKNKYIDKFGFYPANFDLYACTGCGRCIEACLANIDMRQVFRDLEAT